LSILTPKTWICGKVGAHWLCHALIQILVSGVRFQVSAPPLLRSLQCDQKRNCDKPAFRMSTSSVTNSYSPSFLELLSCFQYRGRLRARFKYPVWEWI